MMKMWKPILALSVVSAFALSAATPSLSQTQPRQRQAPQGQGFNPGQQDETFGQAAPRAPSRGLAAQQCWITTNPDLNYGYWGDCSAKGARQVK